RLFSLGSPNDPLVQIRNAQFVVFVVVQEQKLVQCFRHVVNATGTRRIQYFVLYKFSFVGFQLDLQVSFGNSHSSRSVTINAHGPQMGDVDVQTTFNHGRQKIIGGTDVVIYGIALMLATFHGVWCRSLLGKVYDGIRSPRFKKIYQALIIYGHVKVMERYVFSSQLFPSAQALSHWANRRKRTTFKFGIYIPSR